MSTEGATPRFVDVLYRRVSSSCASLDAEEAAPPHYPHKPALEQDFKAIFDELGAGIDSHDLSHGSVTSPKHARFPPLRKASESFLLDERSASISSPPHRAGPSTLHANRIQRLDDPAPPPRVTALDLAALIRQAGGAELKKIELSQLPWEELCRAQPSKPTQTAEKAGVSIDVNSGGAVFFLLFKSHPSEGQTSSYRRMPATPVSPSHAAREEGERACVLKVCGGMGATHSEFFASQLCAPLGVTAPQMRLLRRSHPDWERLRVAVEKVHGGEAVCAHLDCPRNQAMLLMSLVVGSPVLRHEAALSPLKLPATARSFGRLMVLDMLLHNEDRLPCSSLRWRGNPGNMLAERTTAAVFAIDTTVPRMPPTSVLEKALKAYPAFINQVLSTHSPAARDLLCEILSHHAADERTTARLSAEQLEGAVEELRAGVVDALGRLGSLNSWLQALYDALDGALSNFFSAAEASPVVERTVDVHLGKGMRSSREGGKSSIGTFRKAQAQATKAMLRISGAAQRMPVSSHVGEAEAKQIADLSDWLRDQVAISREYIRQAGLDHSISTGFIDDELSSGFLPNAYELYVRLAHIISRANAMLEAGSRTDPLDAESLKSLKLQPMGSFRWGKCPPRPPAQPGSRSAWPTSPVFLRRMHRRSSSFAGSQPTGRNVGGPKRRLVTSAPGYRPPENPSTRRTMADQGALRSSPHPVAQSAPSDDFGSLQQSDAWAPAHRLPQTCRQQTRLGQLVGKHPIRDGLAAEPSDLWHEGRSSSPNTSVGMKSLSLFNRQSRARV